MVRQQALESHFSLNKVNGTSFVVIESLKGFCGQKLTLSKFIYNKSVFINTILCLRDSLCVTTNLRKSLRVQSQEN